MKSENISDAMMKYQQTGIGYEDLVKKIGILVYSMMKDKYKMNEDDRSDFFCMFYKKIPNLIKRFEYYGTPFEAYLNVSIRWNIKSFRIAKNKYRSIQKAILKKPFYLIPCDNDFTEIKETELCISESVKEALRIEGTKEILQDTIKKRLLYIYLIESDYIDERILEGIIRIIGYNRKWLETCSEKLKEKVEIRLNRIELIKTRRNTAFLEFHILQEKCSFAENNDEKDELKDRIKKLRKRIDQMNKDISKAIIRPTHKDIADILQIPKGSIDSGIYYIKNSFREIENIEKKSA